MRSRTWFRTLVVFGVAGALVAVTACSSPPVQAPATTITQTTPIRVQQTPQNQVDVLFMVDNSPSMAAMQNELTAKFGEFFTVFENLATAGTYADLHIGVVTSDYGAGDIAGPPGGCDASPGGQKGVLQAKGVAAATTCAPATDGVPYIEFAFGANGVNTGNVPGGNTNTNLVTQFTCMASGGAGGCGFEHQLESVYQALHNTTDNKGFLRPDALLTIVFVTNEDDGSAAPTAHIYEPNATGMFGEYNTYRQTEWAVSCGTPPAHTPYGTSNGVLSGCVATPNPSTAAQPDGSPDLAFDISRYINYFTKPLVQGGIKADPNDVILVAIDPPTTPFSTIFAVPGTGTGMAPNPAYMPCAGPANGSSCDVQLQHSCQNMVAPAFFGDPPIRLDTVIDSAMYHQTANICGDDPSMQPDYTNALMSLASLISSNIGNGCITEPVEDASNPDCTVIEVTPQADGTNAQKEIPACASNGHNPPCWSADQKKACAAGAPGGSPNGIGIDVVYPGGSTDGGGEVPVGSYLDVQCNTLAPTSGMAG